VTTEGETRGRRWEDDPESADATTGAPLADGPISDGPISGRPIDEVARARALLEAAAVPRPRSRQWLGSRRRQAFAAVIVIGAIGFLAFQGLTNASEYFLTTKQAVSQRATLGGRPFRIEGTVEADVHQAGATTRFDIFASGVTVAVVSTGSPPELFRPGIPVVLEGHWQGAYYASDLIMVKHSASYTEAHPGRLKSQLPTTKSS
jgi:cytochrome c-type biogenesis protein CcmE